MAYHIPLLLFFACWGSFLNVIGYRLVKGLSVVSPRSFCPSCTRQLCWYDNIPLISWIILGGKCRWCKTPISLLYPAIELISIIALYILYQEVAASYFFSYFIFFSALIVSIRSDLETMLISTYTTLGVIPVGLIASLSGHLPITFFQSALGMSVGFCSLWIISAFFTWRTGKKGLGEGDMDLLALIGSFIGPYGVWMTVLIGSTLGSFVGIWLLANKKVSTETRLPFGPFLAFSAMFFVVWHKFFLL